MLRLFQRNYQQSEIKQTSFCFPNELIIAIVGLLSDKDAARFALACKTFERQSFPVRYSRFTTRMRQFLDMVINDRRKEVASILNKYPKLILFIPPETLEIEDRCTWLKVYAKDALTMTVERKQMQMMELLLRHIASLKQMRHVVLAKETALSAWKPYEKENVNGIERIVIPKDYADLAQSLIDVFLKETFPNGVPGADKNPANPNARRHPWDVELSKETEFALQAFLDRLIPKNAVKLDELIDPELLLLSFFESLIKNVQAFKNDWDKLYTCHDLIRGLIQTALIRETGEYFCEDLLSIVVRMENGKQIGMTEHARALKVSHIDDDYMDFYRSEGRVARSGQGWSGLYCGMFGGVMAGSVRDWSPENSPPVGMHALLERLCLAKATHFQKITKRQAGCAIL